MANAVDSEVSGGPHAETAADVENGTGSARDGASTKRLTLTPLGVDQVPIHPELEALQQNPPAVDEFLREVFVEADAEIERSRKSIGKFKDEVEGGDGGKFPVEVAKWKSEGGRGVGTWFGRSSEHVEGKPVGFEELRACLMKGHERNEAEYTPAIYDVKTVLEWDLSGREVAWKDEQKEGTMKEIEMRSELIDAGSLGTNPNPNPALECVERGCMLMCMCVDSNADASYDARRYSRRSRLHCSARVFRQWQSLTCCSRRIHRRANPNRPLFFPSPHHCAKPCAA